MCQPSIYISNFKSNIFSHFFSLFSFTTCKESQNGLNLPLINTVMSQASESMQSEDSRKHPASESRNDDNNLRCVSSQL